MVIWAGRESFWAKILKPNISYVSDSTSHVEFLGNNDGPKWAWNLRTTGWGDDCFNILCITKTEISKPYSMYLYKNLNLEKALLKLVQEFDPRGSFVIQLRADSDLWGRHGWTLNWSVVYKLLYTGKRKHEQSHQQLLDFIEEGLNILLYSVYKYKQHTRVSYYTVMVERNSCHVIKSSKLTCPVVGYTTIYWNKT